MNLPGKKYISELAQFIADEYCPYGTVQPQMIAGIKGITSSFGSYGDAFDGLLEHRGGKFHIFINNDRLVHGHMPRARFTFAHELGHYFIDDHRNALESGKAPSHPSFTNFTSKNVVEWQADYFAACLLLPEERVKTDVFRRKFNFIILDELSKKYQTSITSTAIRFSEIGNHPIMVVCSKNGAVKWKWNSEGFPFYNLKWGNKGGKVPEDTAAGEFFQEKTRQNDTQIVFAGDWFDVYKDDLSSNRFYEHCISSPNSNTALSIIWED